MRLPLLPPETLSAEQKNLYDDMVGCDQEKLGELVAHRKDGALIGPFNGWLHFPQFGRPAWAFKKALWEHSVLASLDPPTRHPGDRCQVRCWLRDLRARVFRAGGRAASRTKSPPSPPASVLATSPVRRVWPTTWRRR